MRSEMWITAYGKDGESHITYHTSYIHSSEFVLYLQGRGSVAAVYLFMEMLSLGRYSERPYCFHDSPYRAGMNPPLRFFLSKLILRISPVSPIFLFLPSYALRPEPFPTYSMLHGENEVSHNGHFVLYCRHVGKNNQQHHPTYCLLHRPRE